MQAAVDAVRVHDRVLLAEEVAALHYALTTSSSALCACDSGYNGSTCSTASLGAGASLTSVSPASVPAYTSTRVTLSGSGFVAGSAVSVSFGPVGDEYMCSASRVVDGSTITCQTASVVAPSGGAPMRFVVDLSSSSASGGVGGAVLGAALPFVVTDTACASARGASVCGGHGTCAPSPSLPVDALVVSYDFDEMDGSIAYDGSGNGYHMRVSSQTGAYNGAAPTFLLNPTKAGDMAGDMADDMQDYALWVNEASMFELPVGTALAPNTSLDAAPGYTLCMTLYKYADGDSYYLLNAVDIYGDDAVYVQVTDSYAYFSSAGWALFAYADFTQGPQAICFVSDAAAMSLYSYLADGTQQSQAVGRAGGFFTSDVQLAYVASPLTNRVTDTLLSTLLFMDDLMLFDRPLAAAEVSMLLTNASHFVPDASLRVHYDFNEGSGSVLHDSAPAHRGDVTILGGAPKLYDLAAPSAGNLFGAAISSDVHADPHIEHGAARFDRNGVLQTARSPVLYDAADGMTIVLRMALPYLVQGSSAVLNVAESVSDSVLSWLPFTTDSTLASSFLLFDLWSNVEDNFSVELSSRLSQLFQNNQPTPYPFAGFHTYAYTLDYASNRTCFYVDDMQVRCATRINLRQYDWASRNMSLAVGGPAIGSSYSTGQSQTIVAIDALRVYNRELTAVEIAAVHMSMADNIAVMCSCDSGYGGARCDQPAPIVSSVSPSSVAPNTVTRLTLSGSSLNLGLPSGSLSLDDAAMVTFGPSGSEYVCGAAVLVSSTQLTCQTPSTLQPTASGVSSSWLFIVRLTSEIATSALSLPFSVSPTACVSSGPQCGAHRACSDVAQVGAAAEHLLLSYDFDELRGDVAYDGTGKRQDATFVTEDASRLPSWAVGGGASGNASDHAYVVKNVGSAVAWLTPISSQLHSIRDVGFSVSVDVSYSNTDNTNGGQVQLFTSGHDTNNIRPSLSVNYYPDNQQMEVYIPQSSTFHQTDVDLYFSLGAPLSTSAGVFSNVMLVVDLLGATYADQIRLYVDGARLSLVPETGSFSHSVNGNTGPWSLDLAELLWLGVGGELQADTSYNLTTTIDNYRLFGRPLNDTEVAAYAGYAACAAAECACAAGVPVQRGQRHRAARLVSARSEQHAAADVRAASSSHHGCVEL